MVGHLQVSILTGENGEARTGMSEGLGQGEVIGVSRMEE